MIRFLLSAALVLSALLPLAARAEERTAKVLLSQVDGASRQVGLLHAIDCPGSGCQTTLVLHVGGADLGYVVGLTFVQQGLYVAMQPQAGNPNQIVEYGETFPGPIFIDLRGQDRIKRTLRLMMFERGGTALSRTTGRYEPDALLRVEYYSAAVAPQS